jgi:hypothetical protein
VTEPVGGPAIEFPEVLFGADQHCAAYDPATYGFGPPNFGWGPPDSSERLCPQHQSGVAGNFSFPTHGTWPVPNRVMRDGAFKAPPLRNVELTGPYFHTGSFLTLRQVVDFYFEGGDFPDTNKESRDPHVVNLEMHTFSFGPSQGVFNGFDLLTSFDCSPAAPNDPAYPLLAGGCGSFSYLVGNFADGLPDGAFLYDEYPDSDHPITPEPGFESRAEALEDAKNSIVKFLLALTDARVKYERAPFDKPELFVPIDGLAGDNTIGPANVAGNELHDPSMFRRIAATGAGGLATPLGAFLSVTNEPPVMTNAPNPNFNCSALAGRPVSHFCSTVIDQ